MVHEKENQFTLKGKKGFFEAKKGEKGYIL
jgi:hypothetical protein